MRTGLDKEKIILRAAELADKKGSSDITMKELADELGIKPPSLYKHFSGGLDELSRELMLCGWRMLDAEITKAVIGKAKDDAVTALCYAYRDFVLKHKGLYEAMQWYDMFQSKEHMKACEGAVDVMYRSLSSYDLTNEQKIHTVRLVRAFLQGFSTIEAHTAHDKPVPLDDSFDFALRTILRGIADMQKRSQ